MRPEPPITADQATFLSALAEWSGRLHPEFPTDHAPCPGVGSIDEDAILAQVFAAMASSRPYYASSHSLSILTSAIIRHQRHLDMAWDAARSSKAGKVADRKAWSDLRPYEAMIGILHSWHSDLHDRAMEEAA